MIAAPAGAEEAPGRPYESRDRMSPTHGSLQAHMGFSTQDRYPSIDDLWRERWHTLQEEYRRFLECVGVQVDERNLG